MTDTSIQPAATMSEFLKNPSMAKRFRGFLPVVVDVETGGFDAEKNALLEIAAVILDMDSNGHLIVKQSVHKHVQPFPGAKLDPEALAFNKIDPYHPFRIAATELDALEAIFSVIRSEVKRHECKRAILVGHNAIFDLGFVKAAATRTGIKRNPFHLFSTFDTAALSGVALGQTVLAHAAREAGIPWNNDDAHSALYDAERTAELFCHIVNTWQKLWGLAG
ncbi:MAG: ribonuclease T [Gammaproteobacteria bacterium]|nr:ribonuclease T [Gammaproteobacteria bacterium]